MTMVPDRDPLADSLLEAVRAQREFLQAFMASVRRAAPVVFAREQARGERRVFESRDFVVAVARELMDGARELNEISAQLLRLANVKGEQARLQEDVEKAEFELRKDAFLRDFDELHRLAPGYEDPVDDEDGEEASA